MLKEQLSGFWKLLSWEVQGADGHVVYPFGPEPRGLLVYGENGLMSAQLGDPRRPNFAANDRALGTSAELKAAFEGYTAYFGRYGTKQVRRSRITRTWRFFPTIPGQSKFDLSGWKANV